MPLLGNPTTTTVLSSLSVTYDHTHWKARDPVRSPIDNEYPVLYVLFWAITGTYDHTHWKARDPVRSPIDKPVRAGLVVGSVTTSEYPTLSSHCRCTGMTAPTTL
ncbi:hypothetical protein ACRALDRAFT_210953 [Sodiomyces alcalophilus JCM 7366]